jgi:hypothetical protein
MTVSSIGQNPCGPLAGNRDRDRRPCEGSSKASATRPVAIARTAFQSHLRRWSWDADARLACSARCQITIVQRANRDSRMSKIGVL